jgi:tRNA G18 (ribose-2'-O)-methylase SpoU
LPPSADGRVVAGDAVYSGNETLVVVAVDVQDPGNTGAIVRVSEAGGATGVIASGATADPFGWKALRGSMGSALRLPVVHRASPGRLDRGHATTRLQGDCHGAAGRATAARDRSEGSGRHLDRR